MISYIMYKFGVFTFKYYLNKKIQIQSIDMWRPGNLPIGKIIKYTSPIIIIFA